MLEPTEKREMEKLLTLNGYHLQGYEYLRKTPYFTHIIKITIKENSIELSDRYKQFQDGIPPTKQYRGFAKFFTDLKTRIEACNKNIMIDPPIEQPRGDYSFEFNDGEWILTNKTLERTIKFTADGKVLFQNIEYTGDVSTIIQNFDKIERDLDILKELKYYNADHKKYGTVVFPRKGAGDKYSYLAVNQDGSLNELVLNYQLSDSSFADVENFMTKPYSETLELNITPEYIEIKVLSKASGFKAEIENDWKRDITEETSFYRALKLSEEFVKTLPGYEALYAEYLDGSKWLTDCFSCGKTGADCKCDFTKNRVSGSVLSTNSSINDVMLESAESFLKSRGVKTKIFRTLAVLQDTTE